MAAVIAIWGSSPQEEERAISPPDKRLIMKRERSDEAERQHLEPRAVNIAPGAFDPNVPPMDEHDVGLELIKANPCAELDTSVDPCAGHTRPDFSSDRWQRVCEKYGVNASQCTQWLEFEWTVGNTKIDESFKTPDCCLP